MKEKKLQQLESAFLTRYPGGFSHPDFITIAKKHKIEGITQFIHQELGQSAFVNSQNVCLAVAKVISRSSMVSLFEKPKFKDFVQTATSPQLDSLASAFYSLLYEEEKEKGIAFDALVAQLVKAKIAKWAIVTALPFYCYPMQQIFVKPTTTKNVIEYFGLPLKYSATPSWQFYCDYKEEVLRMQQQVSVDLRPNNAAFLGFLMMSIPAKADTKILGDEK